MKAFQWGPKGTFKFKHIFILSELKVPLGLLGEMLNTEPIVSKNILLTVTK